MFEQQPQGVGGGVGGGFVGGDDAGHHHRVQVGVGDDIRLFLLDADTERHPAVPVGILAHLLQDGAGELPELADRVGDGDLLLGSRAPPHVLTVCAIEYSRKVSMSSSGTPPRKCRATVSGTSQSISRRGRRVRCR